MRSQAATIPLLTLLTLIATQATAAQFSLQTAPFNLVLLSTNQTINGTTLEACHEGPAIEALCLAGRSPFHLNYTSTSTSTSDSKSYSTPGYLTYELRGGYFSLSSPLSLSYDPTSNVAVPLFEPRDRGTVMAFDERGQLYIPGLDPAGGVGQGMRVGLGARRPFYRWFACVTDAGYVYETLAWVVGRGEPDDATCQGVDVVRVFI